MSSSMTPNDRETLSALFDGELDGDAARFAMRRLDHDANARDACSRWQLAGDVLRGQASGLAPAGFAQRVSAALAAEAEAATAAARSGESRRGPTPSGAQAQAQSRRWWGRAALAASVAVAALFVTRPFSGVGPGDGFDTTRGAPVAVIPAATGAQAGDVASDLAAPQPSTPAAGGAEVAAAAVAVANVPRRVTQRRARAGGPTATAAPRRAVETPMTVALAAAEPAPRPAASPTDPFLPQAGDLITRPWPRAVLPGSSAAGALTASYGTRPASPSFYPFEPDPAHLPAPAEATPNP
jgi:Meckel syndrome type 1 protein